MTTNPKPEALISTPAEAAQCVPCMAEALAYNYENLPTCSRFEATEFAHCDLCGSTDLVDTRSPFEVLVEALANVQAPLDFEARPVYRSFSPEAIAQIEASARLSRMDVVDRVRAIAAQADPGHCSDCTTWAVRASVGGVRF